MWKHVPVPNKLHQPNAGRYFLKAGGGAHFMSNRFNLRGIEFKRLDYVGISHKHGRPMNSRGKMAFIRRLYAKLFALHAERPSGQQCLLCRGGVQGTVPLVVPRERAQSQYSRTYRFAGRILYGSSEICSLVGPSVVRPVNISDKSFSLSLESPKLAAILTCRLKIRTDTTL